jgi:DHA2 family multidrug resistance protein
MTNWIIVFTAVLASLLEILDSSIVNVALPYMQGNLGVTLREVSWVSTGYIITNAVVLPIAAWLGAKFGRKSYFTNCIALFTISSFLCAIAPNFIFLVCARLLQGAAGGALLPTSQAIIQEQFPGKKSGMGSAIFGMSVMVGPAIGPALGGYLTDHFNWRAIFFINIPIGIVAGICSFIFIKNSVTKDGEKKAKSAIDWIGFSLLVLGVGALQLLLERGQDEDWFSSNLILASAVLAVIAIPVFFAWEYQHKNPIVDVKLFKESPVWGGCFLMGMTGMILYSIIYLVPVYASRAIGMDATSTGLLYVPGTLLTMAVMPLVGKSMGKVNPKFLIIGGILCTCISLWQFSRFDTTIGSHQIISAFYFRSAGLGLIFVPINAMVLSQYSGETTGQVAGLMNLSRQIGGSIGIAGVSTLLDRFDAQYLNNLRSYATTTNPIAIAKLKQVIGIGQSTLQNLIGANGAALDGSHTTLAAVQGLLGQAEKQVFQLSINHIMMMVLVIYSLSIIPVYFIKMTKKVTAGAAHAE